MNNLTIAITKKMMDIATPMKSIVKMPVRLNEFKKKRREKRMRRGEEKKSLMTTMLRRRPMRII